MVGFYLQEKSPRNLKRSAEAEKSCHIVMGADIQEMMCKFM